MLRLVSTLNAQSTQVATSTLSQLSHTSRIAPQHMKLLPLRAAIPTNLHSTSQKEVNWYAASRSLAVTMATLRTFRIWRSRSRLTKTKILVHCQPWMLVKEPPPIQVHLCLSLIVSVYPNVVEAIPKLEKRCALSYLPKTQLWSTRFLLGLSPIDPLYLTFLESPIQTSATAMEQPPPVKLQPIFL
jgi:hypothetical protein